jgi:hypothetical protein
MNVKGRFLLAALAAISVIFQSGRSVAQNEPILEGPRVVKYQHHVVLSASKKFIRQGVALSSGGCQFSSQTNLKPGESVTELELAFDPDTCRSLVQSGRLVGEYQEYFPPGQIETKFDSKVHLAPDIAGSPASPPNDPTASLHSWYSDPIGLHVNDVTNTVGWAPNGTCAFPDGTIATTTQELQWLTTTGWQLGPNTWSNGASCANVFSTSNAQFINNVFCVMMTTNTYYQPNSVTGLPNGTANFNWVLTKDGTCSFLLSANHTQSVQ